MSWMTKHTKNLLGDMSIDNKASALNHNSLPVHEHAYRVKRHKDEKISDANKKMINGSMTKSISRIPAKSIDGPKPKGVIKL
jgi:hypothetical protein